MKINIKKRKSLNKTQKTILIVGITLLFFVSTAFIVKDNRKLTFFEKTIKDGVLFINRTLLYPFNIKNNENSIKNYNQIEIDNLKKEIMELKNNLDLNSVLSDYEKIRTTVINRNIGYWYDSVIIDKGSREGIKKDMAVITPEGLIGKIIKTTKNNSTVKLLTSNQGFKVSIQIKAEDNYLYGILSAFNDGYYIVEGISDTKNIKIGSLVSTTGMGDIFPSGILIGEVASIDKDNFDLEAIIKVKPSINIDNFNYLTVLRRKQ